MGKRTRAAAENRRRSGGRRLRIPWIPLVIVGAVVIGGFFVLDSFGVIGAAGGERQPDLGRQHIPDSQRFEGYSSRPATTGPHWPAPARWGVYSEHFADATWCGPCRAEMPALERVASEMPEVVFLELDLQEDEDQVSAFMERLELHHLQAIIDPNGATARRYGIAALPDTFFVGPDGVIRHLEIGGPMDDETIRRGIAKAR